MPRVELAQVVVRRVGGRRGAGRRRAGLGRAGRPAAAPRRPSVSRRLNMGRHSRTAPGPFPANALRARRRPAGVTAVRRRQPVSLPHSDVPRHAHDGLPGVWSSAGRKRRPDDVAPPNPRRIARYAAVVCPPAPPPAPPPPAGAGGGRRRAARPRTSRAGEGPARGVRRLAPQGSDAWNFLAAFTHLGDRYGPYHPGASALSGALGRGAAPRRRQGPSTGCGRGGPRGAGAQGREDRARGSHGPGGRGLPVPLGPRRHARVEARRPGPPGGGRRLAGARHASWAPWPGPSRPTCWRAHPAARSSTRTVARASAARALGSGAAAHGVEPPARSRARP